MAVGSVCGRDTSRRQFFTTLRREIHVVEDFDDTRAREWFAALDYGFAHYTVVLLGCTDGDGNLFVVDEHTERLWLPQRHAPAIKAMLARHKIGDRRLEISDLNGSWPARMYSPGRATELRSRGNMGNSESRCGLRILIA